jgi:spermidine synthase
VEVDPDVARIARERFDVRCKIVVDDGRAFLQRDPRRFDALVLDVFSGGDVPPHLFTREAFELAANSISPGGIFVVHLAGSPSHPAIRAIAHTLGVVFPHVVATHSGRDRALGAVYLFASSTPLGLGPWVRSELDGLGMGASSFVAIDSSGASILTDADNPLAALTRDIADEHRRRSFEIRRSPPW